MLAIVKVKEGAGGIEVRDVPKPQVTDPDQVLVRVRAAGICGSDLHVYEGKLLCDIPVIMGHEFSGEIAEVGAGVSHWKAGDRVVSECNVNYCGMCAYCRTGRPHLCVDRGSIGRQRDGVFTEYILLEPNQLHRIPEGVSFEQAALTEPAANAVHHVLERGSIEPEEFVLVTGPGPIGLLNAQAARAGGAGRVIVTGVTQDVPLRLAAATELGFETVNVQEEDIVGKVLEWTDGIGADVIIEASGAEKAIQQSFDMIKKDGRLIAVGIPGQEFVRIPWGLGMAKVISVTFNWAQGYTAWERALAMIASGKIDVDPLITATIPFQDWEEGFHALQRGESIKTLLIPPS
jgi:L-iditol 2-dehydrogenase